jgi:hypothetical protein
MRAIVRETLYRDMIGFIPVYSLVFAFGLWFGAWQLGWTWLQGLWLIVPLIAASADYLEDVCHLRFLKVHEGDEYPSLFLTWLGAAMTSIKVVALSVEGALTLVIVIAATLRIHETPQPYGWRGALALIVSLSASTIVVGLGIWSAIYRVTTKATRDHDASAPVEAPPLSLQQNT